MAVIEKHQQILLDLLANNLFSVGREIDLSGVDCNSLWYEAYTQTVSLIAFADISVTSDIFKDADSIRNYLITAFSDNTRIDFEHTRIHQLMTDAGIPYVILKGMASVLYYPDPFMRLMGDVDFLVPAEYQEKAREVLTHNGYVKHGPERAFHDVYVGNGCRCELHSEPAGIPEGEQGSLVREMLAGAVDDAEKVRTEIGGIVVPSVFHHGLIILLHMCHHLTGEGLGLRHLCDWAVFVASLSESEFVRLFEDKLRSIGMWKFAQIVTAISVEFLGCPARDFAKETDPELSLQILSDIFNGGNFGQKSVDRSHERLLISSKTENENSMLKQFFVSVNSIVYANWKIVRKLKFLLPLGWLFFGGRYIVRSLMGKRPKIRLKKLTYEAYERKNLYAKLELFGRSEEKL